MKISLNEIKKLVKIPAGLSTDQLVELIGARLVEVEEVIDLSPKYQGIYIVKVVTCEPIPGTHLHLCEIDAGPVGQQFLPLQANAPKAKNQLVQVVCGAPNVRQGMLAAWITPGSVVPSTFGQADEFRLSVRPLRGYDSYGMLAAADELAFGSNHDSIIEIDPNFAKPGDNFAEKFELDDIILDIENKSLTHRPDCFGLIGFAREVAGILGQSFKAPGFLSQETVFPAGFLQETKTGLSSLNNPVTVEIPDHELCPRYTFAIVEAPKSPETPYFTPTQVFLAKAGMQSISPIVDLTNVIMLQTGQPLHAFDYDKFRALGQRIIVRAAKDQEQLTLLDGRTVKCDPNDILITADHTHIALAGAMGGANTAIDDSTTHILLESATFSLYHLRKTQMKHGIFSEAITRFTKGQPPTQTFNVLAETVRRLDSKIIAAADYYPQPITPPLIQVTVSEINAHLGTAYTASKILRTLTNVGFVVDLTHGTDILRVQPLGWRTDIAIKEDVIEEVGRLLGYENIPQTLPLRPFSSHSLSPLFKFKADLRRILSDQLGAHEVLTYSFISQRLLQTVGQLPENSYQIVNSISPDLQYFRQQIVPSLLDKIHENLRAGHQNFALYEINQISFKSAGLNTENVPILHEHLGCVVLGDYYAAKAQLEFLASQLHLPLEFRPLEASTASYLEPLHSASIYLDAEFIGTLGELRRTVANKLKIQPTVASFELNLIPLLDFCRSRQTATKSLIFSKFPSVERDLTLKLPATTTFSEVQHCLDQALASQDLLYRLTPTSIYQPARGAEQNFSFHITLTSQAKTLQTAEISAIMESVTNQAVQALGAQVV